MKRVLFVFILFICSLFLFAESSGEVQSFSEKTNKNYMIYNGKILLTEDFEFKLIGLDTKCPDKKMCEIILAFNAQVNPNSVDIANICINGSTLSKDTKFKYSKDGMHIFFIFHYKNKEKGVNKNGKIIFQIRSNGQFEIC